MSETGPMNDRTDTLEALEPKAVIGYLTSRGWARLRDYGRNGVVLGQTIDAEAQEIIVPIDRQARDFPHVMDILVEAIAKTENRSEADLLSDFSLAGYDVIKIRSPDADDIGSVDLRAGIELHDKALNLLLYTANVAASNVTRAFWSGRRFAEVDEYLSSLRLGQSQRGSFVISLLSRWEFTPKSKDGQSGLPLGEDPFGRKATRALAHALVATQNALRESARTDALAAFRPAIASGVSANLCESLADIAEAGDGADISVRWSYHRPEPEVPVLKLRRGDASVLRDAAKGLSGVEPISDVELAGMITFIKEEPGTFDGVTRLEAWYEGRFRKIRVEFDPANGEQRDRLIAAFRERKPIRITGDVERSARQLTLRNPRNVDFASDTGDELD